MNVVLDVRQRRGVRGSEYAWANSQRLQRALADSGIAYEHLKQLAPTSQIRAAQYEADAASGEAKRTRTQLSGDFKRAYVDQILAAADLHELMGGFDDSVTAALLCVERDPQACHRSLIAERLRNWQDIKSVSPQGLCCLRGILSRGGRRVQSRGPVRGVGAVS